MLTALKIAPFEPLQSAEFKILSMKTVLLTVLASIKRVGDLLAFSVVESCLEFGPANSHVPKFPTTPFKDQVVNLPALPPEELRAHSTRSVASSWALAQGALLTDIYRAPGWATHNTFASFYSLHV